MRLAILSLILSITAIAQGQTPLQDMVKTEQAFSKMAEEKNIRDAFMAFIADDGLLFRPGAVNGKKWMLEHPVPPTDKKPLLAWQPNFAGMALSGDMGFTTGPWEFKDNFDDKKPSSYGHFVTVWKKQADGSWKWVVDIGISHPQSGGPQALWRPPYKKPTPIVFSEDNTESERATLLDTDRKLASATLSDGLVKAFLAYASPEVRLYRSKSLPFIGRAASVKALQVVKGQFSSQPIAGDVSRFADLGYTHGTYEIADATKKVSERGSYVRIWRKHGGVWRVVLDVTNVH